MHLHRHCCEINFISRTHPSEHLRYESKVNGMVLENFTDSTQWTVYKTCGKIKKVVLLSKQWDISSFIAFIRRKPFYSIFTILFPLTGNWFY